VTWRQISQRLSVPKSAVQTRYKELQKKATETPDNGDGNKADQANDGWADSGRWGDNVGPANGGSTGDNNNGWGSPEQHAAKDNQDKNNTTSNDNNGWGNSSSRQAPENVPTNAPYGGWHSSTHHRTQSRAQDYPQRLRLQPDEHWSASDCEILEMLEARNREQKWMTIQACFYNFTGRMVDAGLIERKMGEGRI
jgi:hypothetical protein